MGKYGKVRHISLNPLSYNTAIMGESGIGKTTIVKQMCEKLAGKDGYIALDIGKEDGHDAIEGIVSERVEDWQTFDDIVTDIVENKETDYPDLKVVVIDTYDELCLLAEQEVIRLHNKNRKADAPKIDTINAAYGGFGKGLDKTIEIVLNELWELKKVGVSFIIIAHTKKKDIDDVMSQEQYSILTSNISQKYFNAIKTKLHFLGVAYIDRDVVKKATGKKDIKGKDILKGQVVGESRVINFRDDTYSVDSKSRFADIEGKIPFDVDVLIKTMQDAIEKERSKSGESLKESQKREAEKTKEKEKAASEYSKKQRESFVDEEANEELLSQIKSIWTDSPAESKTAAKTYMKDEGFAKFNEEVPTNVLQNVVNMLSA